MAALPIRGGSIFDLSQIPGGKLHYLVRKDQSCFANETRNSLISHASGIRSLRMLELQFGDKPFSS
jgi:hypothetical protein